jgi:hypothetical protein
LSHTGRPVTPRSGCSANREGRSRGPVLAAVDDPGHGADVAHGVAPGRGSRNARTQPEVMLLAGDIEFVDAVIPRRVDDPPYTGGVDPWIPSARRGIAPHVVGIVAQEIPVRECADDRRGEARWHRQI